MAPFIYAEGCRDLASKRAFPAFHSFVCTLMGSDSQDGGSGGSALVAKYEASWIASQGILFLQYSSFLSQTHRVQSALGQTRWRCGAPPGAASAGGSSPGPPSGLPTAIQQAPVLSAKSSSSAGGSALGLP